MERQNDRPAGRYWVLGGRWVDNAKHIAWPRVFGPYTEYQAACASAETLSAGHEPNVRYLVVADVTSPETAVDTPTQGRRSAARA